MPAMRFKSKPGFTVAELIISMAIMTILMGGMASALVVASHALPDRQQASQDVTEVIDALGRMSGELLCAQSVSQRSSTLLEFSVADRTGDALPDTIRYAWSGTPGDPLTRQFNGGTVVDLIDGIDQFDLTYEFNTASEQPPSVPTQSSELLLDSLETAQNPAGYILDNKNLLGQYFLPSMPLDATEWSVTRIKLMARARGSKNGITAVQLQLSTEANLPSGSVLESKAMNEGILGNSYLWQEFSFSAVSGLSPSKGLCLVLAVQQDDNILAEINYDNSGSGRLVSSDGGASWTFDANTSMLYAVYGTVTSPAAPDPVTREWIHAVEITLRTSAQSSSGARTAVQLLNAPEFTGS